LVEFFLAVFLMVAVAWVFGEALARVKQPALVGQLLAGVLIGPSVLNLVQPTDDLSAFASVAIFFVMFLTGLSLQTKDIIEAGRRAVVLSILAFAIPFVAGVETAAFFGLGQIPSLVVGLTLAITAVPVNSIILMEFGILKTKLGATVITAGVINDILSLVVLSAIMQDSTDGASAVNYVGVATSVATIAAFVTGVLLVDGILRRNPHWLPSKFARLKRVIKARESELGIMLIFSIGVSLVAELAGLQFIIGTFFAGLILTEAVGAQSLKRANEVFSGVTFGLFAPLLFAFIGIEFVAQALVGTLLLGWTLLVVAIFGKLVGGYGGARLVGFSSADSSTVAFLMNSRGFLELVIATITYQSGLIDLSLFSLVVAIGVITTVLSPITARISLRQSLPQVMPAELRPKEPQAPPLTR
jgi:Kef-type K+ transport system membrane component KefB